MENQDDEDSGLPMTGGSGEPQPGCSFWTSNTRPTQGAGEAVWQNMFQTILDRSAQQMDLVTSMVTNMQSWMQAQQDLSQNFMAQILSQQRQQQQPVQSQQPIVATQPQVQQPRPSQQPQVVTSQPRSSSVTASKGVSTGRADSLCDASDDTGMFENRPPARLMRVVPASAAKQQDLMTRQQPQHKTLGLPAGGNYGARVRQGGVQLNPGLACSTRRAVPGSSTRWRNAATARAVRSWPPLRCSMPSRTRPTRSSTR